MNIIKQFNLSKKAQQTFPTHKNITCVVKCNGYDWTFGLSCDFETSVMEWKHFQIGIGFASGSFREDKNGNAAFYFFDSCQNGF